MTRVNFRQTTRSAGLPPADALGGSVKRILVPVSTCGRAADALAAATRLSGAVGGLLRVVHVRIYDPPLRNCGRWYPESNPEATAIIESALSGPWARGITASGVVVEAERTQVARAPTAPPSAPSRVPSTAAARIPTTAAGQHPSPRK